MTTSTDEAARLLRLLEQARTPMAAAELARKLALPGQRETQRRHVRALVEQLREAGQWIVGDGSGVWLTTDAGQWRAYNEGRKIGGKREIGLAARRQRMITDAAGQGLLFVPGQK
jgi:hypothetical protein